jgi:hypothetical protein
MMSKWKRQKKRKKVCDEVVDAVLDARRRWSRLELFVWMRRCTLFDSLMFFCLFGWLRNISEYEWIVMEIIKDDPGELLECFN